MSDRHTRAGPRRGRAEGFVGRFHRSESGQAIYVVVLFFFLLAGLLFLVLSGGEKLNHKVQMQNAADAATAGGAAWYARGLNAVSMCNVTETQLLSLIVLCDTLETVTPHAVKCIDDLMANIGASEAGHDIPIDSRLADPNGFLLVVGNAASEQEIIHRFSDIVGAVPWPDYLTYDTGVLWECTKLMDAFSHAMAKDTPLAAQREAIDIATKNKADFGFLVPLWPALPVVDGQFRDFKEPMTTGHMPPPNNDQIIGGFAWVMNYRGYNGRILGPWGYWREPFTKTQPMGLFDISRFSTLFNIVSLMKLDMLFGGTDDRMALDEKNWEMDYDKAKGVDLSRIRRAWWETSSFDARYPLANDESHPWQPEKPADVVAPFPPPPSGDWPAKTYLARPIPTTTYYGEKLIFTNFTDSDLSRFGVNYRGPWFGPSLAGYTRATESYEGADPREAVWYRVEKRTRAQYPELGIFAPHPPVHPDGTQWPWTAAERKTYFHVTLIRFDGAELGNDETLSRNYLPPAGQTPNLSPIMFDPSTGSLTSANVRDHFTFNGFAYRDGKVHQWAVRFANPNPIDNLVCYAQARVYNRYTWDLFTQHWKVKLMRADRWNELIPELDKGLPSEAGEVAGVLTPERMDPVRQMLSAYSPDFAKGVTH
jgi:hypothetical protein